MSQYTGNIYLQQITYASGTMGHNFKFDFNIGGTTHSVFTFLNPGMSVPFSTLLANVLLPSNPTTIPIQVSVMTLDGEMPYTDSEPAIFTISHEPAEQNQITMLSGPLNFQFMYRIEVIAPVVVVPLTACDAVRVIPTIYNTLYDASQTVSAFSTMDPIIQIGGFTNTFESTKNSIVSALGINPATVSPGGRTFFEMLRTSFDVASLAYYNPQSLPPSTMTQVDQFMANVNTQFIRAQDDFFPYPLPQPLPPPVGNGCNDCKVWMDMLNCLCNLCNNWSSLPPDVQAKVTETLTPHIDSLFSMISWVSGTLFLPAIGGWNPNTPCLKLRAVASFFANICLRCQTINWSVLAEARYHFDQMRVKYTIMQQFLALRGIKSCGTVPPRKFDIPRCGSVQKYPIIYHLLNEGTHDPAFATYGPVATLSDSLTSFAPVRADIVTQLGLTGPLASPSSSSFFDVLSNTLNVLSVAKEGSSMLAQATRRRMDEYVDRLDTIAADAVAIWRPNPSTPPNWCTTCAEWLDLLTCLCRLCDTPQQICGGIEGGIDAILLPDINSLYLVAQPRAASLGIPPSLLGNAATSCGKLQTVFSVISMICQNCNTPDTAFLTSIEPYRSSLRGRVDGFKSSPALACCNLCEGSCSTWMNILGCLDDLCDQSAGFSNEVKAMILGIFGGKVDRLWWILFPAAPPATVTFSVMCSRIPQIMETLPAALCSASSPPSAYMKSQLEILLLDFENGMAEMRPKLTQAGITTCGTGNCDCCMVQSPYIYLQAAGSDASDGSSPGVHLRWGLLKRLGEQHLPKGNLAAPGGAYPTTIGFNKANDFVNIYRAPYPARYAATVATTVIPGTLVQAGLTREWTYPNLQFDGPGTATSIVVRFADVARYDFVKNTMGINPATQPQNFLRNYGEVIEIEAKGKSSFAMDIEVTRINAGAMSMRAEAISRLPNADKDAPIITVRKQFDSNAASPATVVYRVVSEGIQHVRIRCSNCFPSAFLVETYSDFYAAITRRRQWVNIGAFSLSTDDTQVSNRLNNAPNNNVDNLWPKYNDGSKVKTANYMSRWSSAVAPQDGLKSAVTQYLQLSRTDIEAKASFASEILDAGEHTPPDASRVEISYLDALKFVAVDYHVARMLGLGHIDATVTSPTQRYIYMAEYFTTAPIDAVITGPMRHVFLSLPTGRPDYRLPATPDLDLLTFGLRVPNGTDEGALITDSQGYTPTDDVRFINVNLAPLKFDLPVAGFFDNAVQFSRDTNTRPVAYGVEYKKNGETPWRKPELSHDTEFLDSASVPETVPIPEQPNPIFVHREREDGQHHYAIYGINWFSRVSPLGSQTRSTTTTFPNRCTLPPPLNLGVQYIQEEDPRIFTSADEQANHLGDTRVTFYWTHAHNIAYTRTTPSSRLADRVEIYFRATGPRTVRGEVSGVTEMVDGTYRINTRAVPQASRGAGLDIEPVVAAGDVGRFVGSILMTPRAQYVVTSVIASAPGVGATFYVRPAEKNELVDVDGTNTFIATDGRTVPMVNDRFVVAENLNDPAAWTKLTKTVTLQNFSPVYMETVTHEDGSTTTLPMGGIFTPATVAEVTGSPGVYEVTCSTYVLPPAPLGNTNVDWYKGVVRIQKQGSSEFKDLEIWRLETHAVNKLKLYAYDPDYAAAPVRIGAGINVNIHPGYRVYLDPEPANGFTSTAILPAVGEGTRMSYMAVAAYDADLGCRSTIGTPVILLAREESDPVKPSAPTGPKYATRPDFYGRSTYTFDTVVNPGGVNPFALVFARASERTLLDAIYEPATADAIITAVAALGHGAFNQGWKDLVNGTIGGDGRFIQYAGYRLPNPDRVRRSTDLPEYPSFTGANPGAASSSPGPKVINDVLFALGMAFTPLTERPLVYEYIDAGTETSNEKPVIRNANGDLLSPLDPAYDPSPMARKLMAGKVRFTDYTLDGAARNHYFYHVTGLSNRMKLSERSGILGPVYLLNTNPPEAPIVASVQAQLPDLVAGTTTSVALRINPYPETENVTKVRLYRALSAEDAKSIRSMKLLGTFDFTTELLDEFSDLAVVPFGDPLYYRVVVLRHIVNELEASEYVPSNPSKPALASVFDVANPAAPVITATPGSGTTSDTLRNVVLSWPATTYKGTYNLFRLTQDGEWQKIYEATGDAATTAFSYPPAGDFTTYPETAELVKFVGGTGPEHFHRFKVVVESTSGLVSLEDKVKVV